MVGSLGHSSAGDNSGRPALGRLPQPKQVSWQLFTFRLSLSSYTEMKIPQMIEAFVAREDVRVAAFSQQFLGAATWISGLPRVVTNSMGPLVDNRVAVLFLWCSLSPRPVRRHPNHSYPDPLMVPVLRKPVDLVWFGIVFTLANVLGFTTPPVGPSLNVASAVGKVKIEKVSITVLPYLLSQIVLVLIFIFVPQVITVPLGWLT